MDIEELKKIYGPNVEIRKLKNTRVNTPTGFKKVNYIKRIRTSGYLKITLDTGGEIECSDSHRVLAKDEHFVYASQLQPGDILFGDQKVVSVMVVSLDEDTYLYDLVDVEGNVYLTKNGVVNHNCAFIDNIEKTFASAQQTLATGGQAMLLSTPNGIGNFFHSTWVKAELGENTFVPVKLPWQVHPERNQAWRDKQDADLGPRYAGQECDCDFLSSGNTVIEPEDLTYYEETYQCDPVERRGLNGDYWLWQQPDYTRNYIISADVARGDGSDFSAFHVFDVETVEQVAEYKGKIAPRDFGAFLVAVATEWNNALLVVENASVGWSTIEEILARGYNNLYYGTTNQTETAESYAVKLDRDQLTPGFTMSSRTRPLVIAKMTEYIHDKSVVFHSKRLGLELRTFIWLNGKAQAQEGYHDDLVMSFGTCLYVRDTALRLRQQGLDLSKAQLSAFGDLNKRDPAVYTNNRPAVDPYRVYNPKGGYEDISWVLK